MWIDYFHIPSEPRSKTTAGTIANKAYLTVKERLTQGETSAPKGPALEGGVLTTSPGIVNFLHALSANHWPERHDPGIKTRPYDPKR